MIFSGWSKACPILYIICFALYTHKSQIEEHFMQMIYVPAHHRIWTQLRVYFSFLRIGKANNSSLTRHICCCSYTIIMSSYPLVILSFFQKKIPFEFLVSFVWILVLFFFSQECGNSSRKIKAYELKLRLW